MDLTELKKYPKVEWVWADDCAAGIDCECGKHVMLSAGEVTTCEICGIKYTLYWDVRVFKLGKPAE